MMARLLSNKLCKYKDESIPTGWAPPLRRWLRSSSQREGSSLLFNSVGFLLYQRFLFPFTCFQYSTWWYILFSYPYSVGHKFFAIFHPKNFITLLVAVRANGLVDSVSARKFLEAADKTGDKRIFFTVFRLSLQKLLFCKKNLQLIFFSAFLRRETLECGARANSGANKKPGFMV